MSHAHVEVGKNTRNAVDKGLQMTGCCYLKWSIPRVKNFSLDIVFALRDTYSAWREIMTYPVKRAI